MNTDKTLDCKGLNCPMPVVKTMKALEGMNPGEVLRIESTDMGSKIDISAFAKRTGNALLEMKEEGNAFIFFLRKQ